MLFGLLTPRIVTVTLSDEACELDIPRIDCRLPHLVVDSVMFDYSYANDLWCGLLASERRCRISSPPKPKNTTWNKL